MRQCKTEGCQGSMADKRPNALFCSEACKKKYKSKGWRERNREAIRAYSKAYKIEHKFSTTPCICGCGEFPSRDCRWVKGHYRPEPKPELSLEEKIAIGKETYRKNKDKRILRKFSSKENRIKGLSKHAIKRARRDNREFDRLALYALADAPPDLCPVCGLCLDYFSIDRGHAGPHSPSIDRIDSSKGYVPGNMKIICHSCNSRKGNGTVEQLEKVLAYMKAYILP